MKCAHCGAELVKTAGEINRAAKTGARLFCNMTCVGLAKRLQNPPTEAQRKEAKRLYDAKRRKDKADEIRAKKAAYYQRTKDPEKEAARRKDRMHLHIEYCRRPEYRSWKQAYDQRHRAKKLFGEFAEAALLLQGIEREIDQRATRYEVYRTNGTLNKALTRRRSL